MRKLPNLPDGPACKTRAQAAFAGYDHRPSCSEGGIYEMENLSCADAPLLATRPGRTRRWPASDPGGIFASSGGLLWTDGTRLYHDGAAVATVSAGEKRFAELNGTVLLWPDLIGYVPATRAVFDAAPAYTGPVTLTDGMDANGLPAAANTLTAGDALRGTFRKGDAVTLSGLPGEGNNGTFIIRGFSADGRSLLFYEDTFTLPEGAVTAEAATVQRCIPQLDAVCAFGNRLWGCAGDTVYCTKLGDPLGWYWYESDADGPVATAAWSVDTGSPGDFTGCAALRGSVVFTKPDGLYKLYGTKPENFELIASARTGAAAGSGASLAMAGETLFYLAPTGVMATAGGTPVRVGEKLGRALRGGVAGSDGVRYYLSARSDDGAHLFVYDARTGLWSREDNFAAAGFALYDGVLYALGAGGVWQLGTGDVTALRSLLETGDYYSASPNQKRLLAVLLRIEAAPGTLLTLSVQYDSDGVWRDAGAFRARAKCTVTLPLVPRRCDHFRLRLQGVGAWRLLGIARREEATPTA